MAEIPPYFCAALIRKNTSQVEIKMFGIKVTCVLEIDFILIKGEKKSPVLYVSQKSLGEMLTAQHQYRTSNADSLIVIDFLKPHKYEFTSI